MTDQLPILELVNIGYVEILTQCPQCRLLVKSGVENCESCRASLPPSRPDSKIFIAVRGERKVPPNERTTPFVECPNCHKLLEYGTEVCPECREEIDPRYALGNSIARVLTAMATNSAEPAEHTTLIAGFFAIISVGALALGWQSGSFVLFYLSLLPFMFGAYLTLGWLRRYGWLPLQDEDFLSAKRRMKSALLTWLGLLAAQLLVFGLSRLR